MADVLGKDSYFFVAELMLSQASKEKANGNVDMSVGITKLLIDYLKEKIVKPFGIMGGEKITSDHVPKCERGGIISNAKKEKTFIDTFDAVLDSMRRATEIIKAGKQEAQKKKEFPKGGIETDNCWYYRNPHGKSVIEEMREMKIRDSGTPKKADSFTDL